jgi:hypothetical protein
MTKKMIKWPIFAVPRLRCPLTCNNLFKGVERNLEVENRRRFLRNVQAYRMQLKSVEELVLD